MLKVLNDDDIQFDENNPLLRVATCSLQAETNIEQFILTLPQSIQALSLIQSFESGNKTLRTSYVEHFNELLILELQGSELMRTDTLENKLTIEIDTAIITLQYLNLDKVEIKNSNLRQIKYEDEKQDEDIEIMLKSESVIEKEEQPEILPYYKYKEIQKDLESPLLTGFTNLILARINACNLQNIHWEMFSGLQNLKYLMLERNNLKFIPSFAFYGTPNLMILSLAWNNLLNIQITDLAGLLELEYLDLSHNNFSQLSELSFPPFPKLKLADFRDNPITAVFPNTFDIMNRTDSIILGGEHSRLQLLPNSFLGLNKLMRLTIHNVDVPVLKQMLFTGMPVLKELVVTGNVNKIEFDAFLEIRRLETLILSKCNITTISMDSFYGLQYLTVLDLSKNQLKYLPPKIFDEQKNLKELLLNGNQLTELPKGVFDKIPAKLIRLNDNPWHCTCEMLEWNPMVTNKVKQRLATACNMEHDKGINCVADKMYAYRYENRVAPKCQTPNKVKNNDVFQAMKILRCKNPKLKYKKQKMINGQIAQQTAKPVKIPKYTKAEAENATEIIENKGKIKEIIPMMVPQMKNNIENKESTKEIRPQHKNSINNYMNSDYLKNIKIQNDNEANVLFTNYKMVNDGKHYQYHKANDQVVQQKPNKKKKHMQLLLKLQKTNERIYDSNQHKNEM